MSPRFRVPKQRGVALPIAMIVLVAMLLAAVTLIRSVDTATMVAGNLTYKQRATHAADEGVRAAFIWLRDTSVANVAALSNSNSGEAYYSSQHAKDPDWNPAANWPPDSKSFVDANGNTVSYVIHRLCILPGKGINDEGQNCSTWDGVGTRKPGASYSSDDPGYKSSSFVYYRITTRAVGPRNATSYVQTLVLIPSS